MVYVMISLRYRMTIKILRAYPGTDVNLDHNPAIFFFLDCHSQSWRQIAPKFELSALQINQKVQDAPCNDSDHRFSAFIEKIQEAAAKTILTVEKKKLSISWFYPELKEMLRKRQVSKENHVQYKLVNNFYKEECKKSKEKWLQ